MTFCNKKIIFVVYMLRQLLSKKERMTFFFMKGVSLLLLGEYMDLFFRAVAVMFFES